MSNQGLVRLAKERRARLEDSLRLYKFFGDVEEEEIFIKEGEQLMSSKEVGKDLISLTRLQQRHEVGIRFLHKLTSQYVNVFISFFVQLVNKPTVVSTFGNAQRNPAAV